MKTPAGRGRWPRQHRHTRDDSDLAPGTASARMTLVIASSQRSGTNMLGSLLTASGRAGTPREYLGPGMTSSFRQRWGVPTTSFKGRTVQLRRLLMLRRRWWVHQHVRPGSIPAYLDQLVAHRSSDNGVFSIKLFPQHVRMLRDRCQLDVDVFPQPLVWIYLHREDLVGKAISQVRAQQTNVWMSEYRPGRVIEPFYDGDAIAASIAESMSDHEFWTAEFERLGVEPLRLTYAELVADPEATTNTILERIGAEPVEGIRPATERQADELSAEFRRRFLREYPQFVGVAGEPGDG